MKLKTLMLFSWLLIAKDQGVIVVSTFDWFLEAISISYNFESFWYRNKCRIYSWYLKDLSEFKFIDWVWVDFPNTQQSCILVLQLDHLGHRLRIKILWSTHQSVGHFIDLGYNWQF